MNEQGMDSVSLIGARFATLAQQHRGSAGSALPPQSTTGSKTIDDLHQQIDQICQQLDTLTRAISELRGILGIG